MLVVVRVRKIELFYDRPGGFAYIKYIITIVTLLTRPEIVRDSCTASNRDDKSDKKRKQKKKSDRPHDPSAKSPRDRRRRVPQVQV